MMKKGVALRIGQILFSEGTYQIEVLGPKKEHFWPFLHLNDDGKLIDSFCTCERGERCTHIRTALAQIFHHHEKPLHVRFRSSLWNRLCCHAAEQLDYSSSFVEREDGWEAFSESGKRLVRIEGMGVKGKEACRRLLFDRDVETEETSLKFSHLPPEEIKLWRENRPSTQLRYELSFWSDLAKEWMLLEEAGEKYELSIREKEPIPNELSLHFGSWHAIFYISELFWPELLWVLKGMKFPLPIYAEPHSGVEAMHYDAKEKKMWLKHKPAKGSFVIPEEEGTRIGEWLYVPKSGFFLIRTDPLLEKEWLDREGIEELFRRHLELVKRTLDNAVVHEGAIAPKYHLFFDKKHHLHITCGVFEAGDLHQEGAESFGPWVYLPNQGFALLESPLFHGSEQIISPNEISDFIDRHRNWLNQFEGFSTHLFSMEMRLQYQMTEEGLIFTSHLATPLTQSYIDCGRWIYIEKEGFFGKAHGTSMIQPGLVVKKDAIPDFIEAHHELEYVKGFFAMQSPLEKSGLEIQVTWEGKIQIAQRFFFREEYKEKEVLILGEYTYVEGEGFCAIPASFRLPPSYAREKILAPSEEENFVLYEYPLLRPLLLSSARELTRPETLTLHLLCMKQKGKEWVIECMYRSELGEVSPFAIWQALQNRASYLLSNAGCLLLRLPRWNWLKQIPKKNWLKKGKELKVHTLAWLRLNVFEEMHLPLGKSVADQKTRAFVAHLENMVVDVLPPCIGLRSSLRPYQEIGVRWLWFLFTYGLSGLLCDEMGLGKTHQAMALIAGIKGIDPTAKILIVCPTSVLYHWEELLKQFLPNPRVTLFYGVGRTLEVEGEILLTSYGVLRSEQKILAMVPFTLAIFDEVQNAKNAESQTHRALRKIQANMFLGLTGTPVENRLLELKALFDLILPNYLPPMASFKELFVYPIEKMQDVKSKALLTKLIKPFLLRRRKRDVLSELPEKIEEIAFCTLSPIQKELYRKAFLARRDLLLEELMKAKRTSSYIHVFSLISTLKRICDHPTLITKEFEHFEKIPCGKWDLFVELLQEALGSGHKLVVFSQYLEMMDLIERYLQREQIGYASIRGATLHRKQEVARFREDPECSVFVASLQAAGVGIDLTAGSVVIHYDRWWNPARENQATDRVHRIGQNRGVQVFKLVTRHTIEEHIHALIQKKLSLFEGVIGFDDQDYVRGFHREELIEIVHSIQQSLH